MQIFRLYNSADLFLHNLKIVVQNYEKNQFNVDLQCGTIVAKPIFDIRTFLIYYLYLILAMSY